MDIKTIAAGILHFFDNGKTVLLSKEFRKICGCYGCYAWMEHGGKKDNNETYAKTANREAMEETADTLDVTLEQVQKAKADGHYVDHFNEKSGVFYRMYCVKVSGPKPDPEVFKKNAVGKESVEKVEWRYFNTDDVLNNVDGVIRGTDERLYSTMIVRLEKLKGQAWLNDFLNLVDVVDVDDDLPELVPIYDARWALCAELDRCYRSTPMMTIQGNDNLSKDWASLERLVINDFKYPHDDMPDLIDVVESDYDKDNTERCIERVRQRMSQLC